MDCALTRLARDPSAFKATVEPTQDGKGYRLLLDAPGRAEIFTGTMLAFTSWAYMHDVCYRRSEIVVDAATHRPLEEKDYDDSGKLVAAYTFSDYLEDPAGAAPGRTPCETAACTSTPGAATIGRTPRQDCRPAAATPSPSSGT